MISELYVPVPVQENTGAGYSLNGKFKHGEIAEAHKEEVEDAVVKYFNDNYKVDVQS